MYWFALRAVGRGGAEETNTTLKLRIETDGAGVPLGLTPNAPIILRCEPRDAGKFLLTWDYSSIGEQIPPSVFNIYHNNGSGAVDYDTAIASVSGTSYKTGSYDDGTVVIFAVRSESSDSDEETNTATASATADATGPDAVGAPTIAAGVET